MSIINESISKDEVVKTHSVLLKQDNASPHVLFDLNFQNGFTALTSGGVPEPVNNNLPELVSGMHGRYAARFKEGQVLHYQAAGNLLKSRGSIALWFRMPVDGAGLIGQRFTLFHEDAAGGPGNNAMQLWLNGAAALRFDVDDSDNTFSYMPQIWGWRKEQWHHLLLCWDAKQGGYIIYLDGERSTVGNSRNLGPKSFIIPVWEPIKHQGFLIGASDKNGRHAWHSDIAEIRIFDGPLSEEEAKAEFLRHGRFDVKVTVTDPYLYAKSHESCRIILHNLSDEQVRWRPTYSIENEKNVVVVDDHLDEIIIGSGEKARISIPVLLHDPGYYTMIFKTLNGKQYISLVCISKEYNENISRPKLTLVDEISAVELQQVIQSGVSHIVQSTAGKYREAGLHVHDRFALKFSVKEIGELHMAVIRYPDDKARTMEIVLQNLLGYTGRQGQCGVFTGNEYITTGKMLEHSIVFRPASTRMAFIFMTGIEGQPAAVADMKVYRMEDGFSSLEVKPFKGSVIARSIGLYYEDPQIYQNFGTEPFFPDFKKAVDMQLDYMQWFGQDCLSYPLAWYSGTLYGSEIEPLGQNRANRPHPYNYPQYLLKKMHVRGMKFIGNLHLHDLPSLFPYAITDEKRIYLGEETVINMRCDNHLYFSTRHSQDTSYNPIDPRVQQAVKNVIAEILHRYGDEPAFYGIRLVLNPHKLFSFGSLESGYNDINLQRFQKDSAINIPVYSSTDAQRFRKSYDWLMLNAKEAWIDWRCRKIHEYYKEIADMLIAKRKDLKLDINPVPGQGSKPLPILGRYLLEPDVWRQYMREWGIDAKLFANDENITFSYTFTPADYRHRLTKEKNRPELIDTWTRSVVPEITESLRRLNGAMANIHDRYFEDAIGANSPLSGLGEAPGVVEIGWRVSAMSANTYQSLEAHVAALNNFDALSITKGGLVIGTLGIEPYLGEFARAYRTLPAVKFEDIECLQDPIRVRQRVIDGKCYFYVLNSLPIQVEGALEFIDDLDIVELTTQQQIYLKHQKYSFSLKPYELKTYAAYVDQLAVVGGSCAVEQAFIDCLAQQISKVEKQLLDYQQSGNDVSEILPYFELANSCIKNGHYARLYFLLKERWVKELGF